MTMLQEQTDIETHEEQLERLTLEVETLRQELRRSQRLATVGTMTAMVAHEFNNILTPIINYAQLAKTNPKMVEKAIARAWEGGQRATEICKALLGVTRNQAAEAAEENLLGIVTETLSAMARKPERDAIEMIVDIPEDLIIVTRRLELQQVILNLLVNARTAVLTRPTGRRIELVTTHSNGHITIRVSDNGKGIEPENIGKIFQPFFSTHANSEDKSCGYGLGLAICSDIITSMNGDISVTSTVDQGTTFTMHLPK